MNSIGDPFDDKEMQKLATIYRNIDLNYVYVCSMCECTFTDIVDTLSHVDSHFDEKVNIAIDKSYEFVDISKVVSDTIDVSSIKTEFIVDAVDETVDENGVEKIEYASENQLDSKVEPEFNDHQDSEQLTVNKVFGGTCKLCSKSFDTATLLIVHTIYDHDKGPIFNCPTCSQSWGNKLAFFNHLKKHVETNETTYDVLIDKILSDPTDRKVIVKKKRPAKSPHACPQTKYQLKSEKTCDICQMTFPNRKKIYNHMRRKHISKLIPKPTYDCDKCNRKIAGKFAFYVHHYGHLTVGDAVNVTDENVLEANLRKFLDENIYCDVSTSDRKFRCKLCSNMTVISPKTVKLHILQRHVHYVRANTARKYPCPHCCMSYTYESTLIVHLQIHGKDKKFTCSICQKSFAQLRYLRTHEITHSDVKSHQCTICGDTFRTTIRLNYHMRTHSNVTAKCTICNKELKRHRLKQHVRDVHESNHRPFSCSHCTQTFKTARTLKNHAYRHTGEKNFGCRFSHCNEMFISSAARRSHERSKHEPH